MDTVRLEFYDIIDTIITEHVYRNYTQSLKNE